MAKCVYCGDAANSAEHWLPRGFGVIKDMTLLQDRLCNLCNSALGVLDEEILRTGPTAFVRSLLKIEGRHGKTVNLFHYKVMGKESATALKMKSPYGDHIIFAEAFAKPGGDTHARALRQLVFKMRDGEMVAVQFPPTYDGIRLKALLKERGVEGAVLEEVYLGVGEGLDAFEGIRPVLLEAVGPFNTMVYGGEGAVGQQQDMMLSSNISLLYLRGLAKLGFHYYMAVSQTHTGAELLFQPIRRFIRHGEGDWHSFVDLTTPQFIPQLAEGKIPVGFSHFFGCNSVSRQLLCAVQFWVGPEHLMPPSLVRLGFSSRPVEPHCHWVSYYDEKTNGYNGEIMEVLRQP